MADIQDKSKAGAGYLIWRVALDGMSDSPRRVSARPPAPALDRERLTRAKQQVLHLTVVDNSLSSSCLVFRSVFG